MYSHEQRIDIAEQDRDIDDRTRRYFGKLYPRLCHHSILVVGAGAVGSEVLKNLVMMGVRNIRLVDFDKVSTSNLNRCIFFKPEDHDVTYKVDAISRYVHTTWPQTKISCYRMTIQEAPEEVWQTPLVIVAVDNNQARHYINLRVLSCENKPFVLNGATGRSFLEAQVLLPGATACMLCSWGESYFQQLFRDMAKESCDEFFHKTAQRFPAISILSSMTGAILAGEAVKILVGLETWKSKHAWEPEHIPLLGKCVRYDIREHEFSIAPLRSNPKCVEIFCRQTNKGKRTIS